MAQLVKILAMPSEPPEALLVRNAAGVTFQMIHPPQDQEGTAALTTSIDEAWQPLPIWMGEFDPKTSVWAASRDAAAPRVMLRWPQSLAQARVDALCPGVILLPGAETDEDDQRQLVWRHGLALFNVLQVLPGLLLATDQGVLEQDYDVLQPKRLGSTKGEQPAANELNQAWDRVLDQALESLHAGISALASAALPAPDEVGYELAFDGKTVEAEAELAWTGARVAVLAEHQFDYQFEWERHGWHVVLASGDWTETLTALLQVNDEPR